MLLRIVFNLNRKEKKKPTGNFQFEDFFFQIIFFCIGKMVIHNHLNKNFEFKKLLLESIIYNVYYTR